MKTFAQLCEKFGTTVANTIRSNKKELQSKRKASDPIWVMAHPDCPDSEDFWLQASVQLAFHCSIFVFLCYLTF